MGYNLGTASGEIIVNGKKAVEGFGVAASAAKGFIDVVKDQSGALEEAGKKMMGAGIAGSVGMIGAITVAASFEQRLSGIQAVSGATAAQMKKVSEASLRLGADSVFTANDAALAFEELIKAGVSVENALNGAADAAVALAAAGDISLPAAAEIAANAMNSFKMSAEEVPKVADILAGAANASAIGVSELGVSLSQVSAVANLAGLSLEETAVAIAQLGNYGIKGSDAGTSLKTMLMNLQPVSEKQKKKFDELGITVDGVSNKFFDAQGNVKKLADIQQVLFNVTKDMTREEKLLNLEIMFGADAIRAASIMATEGAAGYNEMAKAMGAVTAEDVAATRLDNVAGAVEEMKGALESASIALGKPFLGAIKTVVFGLAGLINAFNNLPGPVKDVIAVLFAVGSGIGILGGAIIHFLPHLIRMIAQMWVMRQFRAVFDVFKTGFTAIKAGQGVMTALSLSVSKLSTHMQKTAGQATFLSKALLTLSRSATAMKIAVGAAGLAIVAAAAAYIIWQQHQADTEARIESLTDAIRADTGALGENTRAWALKTAQESGIIEAGKKIGLTAKDVVDAMLDEAVAAQKVADAVQDTKKAYGETNQVKIGANGVTTESTMLGELHAALKLEEGLRLMSGDMEIAKERNKDFNDAVGDGIGDVDEYGNAIEKVGDKARDSADAVKALTDAIFKNSDASARAASAEINFEESIDDVRKALKKRKEELVEKYKGEKKSAKEAERLAAADMKSGKAFDKNTESGRKLYRVGLQLQEATKGQVKSLLEIDPSGKKASEAMERARKSFIKSAAAAGIGEKEAAAMAKEFGLIPGNVETQFKSPGAGVSKKEAKEIKKLVKEIPELKEIYILAKGARPSKEEVETLLDSLDNIPPEKMVLIKEAYEKGGVEAAIVAIAAISDKEVKVTVPPNDARKGADKVQEIVNGLKGKEVVVTVRTKNVTVGIGRAVPRAKGGPTKKRRLYWVGENGPELFSPDENGQILSADKSQSLIKGVSGVGKDMEALPNNILSAMMGAQSALNTISRGLDKPIGFAPPATTITNAPTIIQNISNPIAEKSSISSVKQISRIGSLGVFG